MSLAELTEKERKIILECLQAAVSGPFFPMWEFNALFGLEHAEVADIAFGVPPLDDSREQVRLAINNALNMLTGYPHKRFDIWSNFISVPPTEVRELLKKWKGPKTLLPFHRDVFEELM